MGSKDSCIDPPLPPASRIRAPQGQFRREAIWLAQFCLPAFGKACTLAHQHEPPCQPRAPVNRRKRRFRSGIVDLQHEPWGFMSHPGGAVLKPETSGGQVPAKCLG